MTPRDTWVDKLRRALGGEDKRPPVAWPFPTWKGQPLRAQVDGGPPAPARRGPKRKGAP